MIYLLVYDDDPILPSHYHHFKLWIAPVRHRGRAIRV